MAKNVKTRWNSASFRAQVERDAVRELDASAMELQGHIIASMKQGNLTGGNPSDPGDPPAVVTSRLKGSITFASRSRFRRVIGSDLKPQDGQTASVALMMELGTRPHLIPNAFGRGVEVQHPGTEPRPFLRPALDWWTRTRAKKRFRFKNGRTRRRN